MTDIAVASRAGQRHGHARARLRFPLITITNTGALADDVVVDIPLPGFATVDTISSSGNCAGTTTLQCAFDSIASGASATIDVQLLTSAEGTFTSNVTMAVDNDSTSSNNAASVALTVTAPTAPPNGGGSSSSGGAKKGGGRLEWLALAFLGLSSPAAAPAQFVSRSVLLTNATCVPSGDHDGTLIVPWPP